MSVLHAPPTGQFAPLLLLVRTLLQESSSIGPVLLEGPRSTEQDVLLPLTVGGVRKFLLLDAEVAEELSASVAAGEGDAIVPAHVRLRAALCTLLDTEAKSAALFAVRREVESRPGSPGRVSSSS